MQLAGPGGMHLRYDRGTIVIDRGDSRFDPADLPGVAWDPRVSGWRAPAHLHAPIVRRLFDANVRISDTTGSPAPSLAWTVPELRWYQDAALAAWGAAGQRGVVVLPTGAGKTILAIAAMARLGVATLCLVPTLVLLDQWALAIARCYARAPGRIGDGVHQIEAVTIATYASAITWAPRIGDRFGMVVIDEAHHVGAECPREVLEMLVAPARLGLTATPPIDDSDDCLDRCVGPVVYALAIDDLVGDALSEFDLITVPVRLSPDERSRYQTLRRMFTSIYAAFQNVATGAAWDEFVTAAMRSADGRAAVAAWRASRALLAYPAGKQHALRELLARHGDARTLVFTADNATAYAIAREFLVMPITHEISAGERAEMLARFRSGDAPVLISSQVLDEGFDVPEAEVAIVVGGSGSTRRHVQRIGRVLRPRDGKRARVYELAVQDSAEIAQMYRRRAGLATGAAP